LRANLALVRGGAANGELTRRAFENFGRAMADYFVMGTRPRAEALALAEERRGFENLRAVIDEGKGALLVTAHLGLFEFGSLLMEELGNPTVIVTLPEPSPALSRWRSAYRQRWGAETLEVGDDHFGFVEITRQLSAGKCVALLADRPHGANFVLVDFPHGKVPFSTGPAWLSLLSGSPMVAVTVVGTTSGRYRVEAHPPIRTSWQDGAAGRDETVAKYTVELGNIFCEVICQYPDQWYQFVPLSPRR
jgi:lauroyl/myristoyl acyltransferase